MIPNNNNNINSKCFVINNMIINDFATFVIFVQLYIYI